MDGAIYLDMSGRLYAIGCILEGKALENEDLSYGARHRSAARYTNAYEATIAITVSEDGHCSVFHKDDSSTKLRSRGSTSSFESVSPSR